MTHSPHTPTRHGSTLIDILVALPLIALLGILAIQLLLGVHRSVIRTDGALGATRELRHGASVLSSEIRGLRPQDLVAWADTAVEFDATVGMGVACAISADRTSIDVVAADGDAAGDHPDRGPAVAPGGAVERQSGAAHGSVPGRSGGRSRGGACW